MIDPHVHLRDFNESHKETIHHGLKVAYNAGLDGVFEMPNTDPPLTSKETIVKRIRIADAANVPIFHALLCGLTKEAVQVKNAVILVREFFPRVIGLKLYAGISTGSLAVVDPDEQNFVIQALTKEQYDGVLSVHCEKVSRFNDNLANPTDPFSHTLVRPPESEVESIRDIIEFAEKNRFHGTLHICHVSVPESVEEIDRARARKRIKITCGVTPHHALMWDDLMKKDYGYLLRMNPPLRPRPLQEKILEYLLEGKIDWIETDHAPHTIMEKRTASGIPVLPFYPHFIKKLKEMGMDETMLRSITHSSIAKTFNVDIKEKKKSPDYGLQSEYVFDPFIEVR